MTWVAGADGCRAGWVVVARNMRTGAVHVRVARTFAEVMGAPESPRITAVDIPIGLPDHAEHGGRPADRAARELLGRPRMSSVFSPPVRGALRARDYAAAVTASRASSAEGIGISKQTFGILPKIADVDVAMDRGAQSHVKECHPELAFAEMASGGPLRAGKKTGDGQRERLALLKGAGFADPLGAAGGALKTPGVAVDDLLDAFACCWTAGRILDGRAVRVPERPGRDARGLLMEIWR